MFNPLFIVAAQNFQRALRDKEEQEKKEKENEENFEKTIDNED